MTAHDAATLHMGQLVQVEEVTLTVTWLGPTQTLVMVKLELLQGSQTAARTNIWVAKFTGGAAGVGVGTGVT